MTSRGRDEGGNEGGGVGGGDGGAIGGKGKSPPLSVVVLVAFVFAFSSRQADKVDTLYGGSCHAHGVRASSSPSCRVDANVAAGGGGVVGGQCSRTMARNFALGRTTHRASSADEGMPHQGKARPMRRWLPRPRPRRLLLLLRRRQRRRRHKI
jgi:hypothetical protein